jgi:hypothetical protein
MNKAVLEGVPEPVEGRGLYPIIFGQKSLSVSHSTDCKLVTYFCQSALSVYPASGA